MKYPGQRRQGCIENRVVDDTGEQAQAENEKDLLATRMAFGPLRVRRAAGLAGRTSGGKVVSVGTHRFPLRVGLTPVGLRM